MGIFDGLPVPPDKAVSHLFIYLFCDVFVEV